MTYSLRIEKKTRSNIRSEATRPLKQIAVFVGYFRRVFLTFVEGFKITQSVFARFVGFPG
jgi:hypothetical protein